MENMITNNNAKKQSKHKSKKNDVLFEELNSTILPHIHYTQKTSIWCGISSFLMALSWIQKWYIPDFTDEKKRISELRHMHWWIPLFEIIKLIDIHNIKMVAYYGERIENFDINNPLVSNYIKTIKYMINKWSLSHQEGIGISIETIIEELKKNRYILINGTCWGIPHMRLCIWYKWDSLLIADPLIDNIVEYDKELFEENCSPPFWKRFISIYR